MGRRDERDRRVSMSAGPRGTRGGAVDPDRESDLVRLVELEDRIARHLAATEEEAGTILEEARVAARRAGERQAEETERQLAALADRIESDCRRRIDGIEHEARRETDRFDRAGTERLDLLATLVVEHLLGTAPPARTEKDGVRREHDHQDDPGEDPGPAREAH